MDLSETNGVSQAESNKKNRVSQVMSRSFSLNVDNCQNPLTLAPDFSKIPELKTDKDIEDVLNKISELLSSNSGLSSGADLDDSRSIEEILREAEEIVRDSSTYFEAEEVYKLSHVDGCNIDALSDRTECSVELEPETTKNLPNGTVEINETSNLSIKGAKDNKISKNGATSQCSEEKHLTLKDLDVPTRSVEKNIYSLPESSSVELSKHSPRPHRKLPKSPKELSLELGDLRSSIEISQKEDGTHETSFTNFNNSDVSLEFKKRENSIKKDVSISKAETLARLGIISLSHTLPKELPTVHSHRSKTGLPTVVNINMDELKKNYEEKIFDLERQIRILSSKINDFQKSEKVVEKNTAEQIRLALLEKEVKSQEELIAGYQRENQRLLVETNKAKKVWLDAEQKLTEKVRSLERELKRANQLNTTEALELKEALADAREELTRLEEDSIQIKNDKREIDKRNEELAMEAKRLRKESEGFRVELERLQSRDKDRERRATAEASLASANLQGKLSQANSELARKQTEVVRMNTEISRLRGELERARLGSVVGGEVHHSASHQVRQMEVALERERDNSRRTLSQLESINKHNLDLARQVKELEMIVKKRTKSGGGIPWGDDSHSCEHKIRESLELKNRKLEQELLSKDKLLSENQAKLLDLQNKYDKEVNNLQEKVREFSRRGGSGLSSRRSNGPPLNNDSQLLATIRGLKTEIATKDKQLSKITRELDETKKKMTKSQIQPKISLNNRQNSNLPSKLSESSSNGGTSTFESGHSSKNYNPFLFEEDRETFLFLRNENQNLHEEVKKLEQDLINLHNKRIQDLSELESNHSAEVKRALREQTARQTNSQITHLRGQVYTQQMVINHLKNQIKVLEQRNQEVSVLKAERNQLEESLLEANKKVATLHQLSSPDSSDYTDLLEKLEWLERRHELREAKLQSIVKELVARQQTSNVCSSSSCKDKLYNKNREICYYRAEMDKILDSLVEFKYIK